MHIAVLGATSQIARDLVSLLSQEEGITLSLFSRSPARVSSWLSQHRLQMNNADYSAFPGGRPLDAILNFVGAGDPARAQEMGSTLLEITRHFDELAMDYVRRHPACRYVFLSSGAVYGDQFSSPVTTETPARLTLQPRSATHWYAMSKVYAEYNHRAHAQLPIIDLRVFSYFSRQQDLNARFLVCDMLRAAWNGTPFVTTADDIVRDYIHPADLAGLMRGLLNSAPVNQSVDCVSLAPVSKFELIKAMSEEFGLLHQVEAVSPAGTEVKRHYYSLDQGARQFGFTPTRTSLQSVIEEAKGMFIQRTSLS